MSTLTRMLLAGLLALAGLGIAAVGGVIAWVPATAEARLAVRVAADPTVETFPGILDGALRIAATLTELSTFDAFREDVTRSGFAMTSPLLRGSSEDRQRAWKRVVTVTRAGDSLVLRVRARAASADDARALAGAVAHMLALRAPTIVGDHIVQARVEQMPVLIFRGRPRVGYALVGGGGVVALAGLVGLLAGSHRAWFRRRTRGGQFAVVASPTSPSVAPLDQSLKPSPEDARYWLQKFLEQHQRTETPRKSAADVQTWDDVPEPTRGTPWLKPPDALMF